MKTRIPKIKSSIEKKERLSETCFYLLCTKSIENINTNDIADYAKVSVGTLYSYFENKEDIIFYALSKYSKSLMFPILTNLKLIKFNNLSRTINKMINVSIEIHSLNQEAHQKILSIFYSEQKYFELYQNMQNNEVNEIYNKCIESGLKEENLKETISVSLKLIENFVHDKVFMKEKYINYDKQKLLVTQTILRLWNNHI